MKFRTLLVVNKISVFASRFVRKYFVFGSECVGELLSVLQKVDKTAFLILCSEAEEEIRLVTKADAFNGLYSSSLIKKVTVLCLPSFSAIRFFFSLSFLKTIG